MASARQQSLCGEMLSQGVAVCRVDDDPFEQCPMFSDAIRVIDRDPRQGNQEPELCVQIEEP